jgi:hypothetical protein
MNKRIWLGLALSLLLLLMPAQASAWWEYGHQVIARIGVAQAKPQTRAAVVRLLGQARLLDTPTCPARTVDQASVWPDCIRSMRDRFSYTAPWHYQNVDVCKPFALTGACRDGNCVSAQVERNLRLLKDRSLPQRERVAALAFLIHFVGDLHMPLHAGDRGDLGGNRFPAFYGAIRSNLHSIWDGYLAERAISTPPASAAGLLAGLTREQRGELAQGTVADWSREVWQVAHDAAYGSALTNPCAAQPPQPPVLAEAQVRALIPVVRLQVQRAGLRLAHLLDEALGG